MLRWICEFDARSPRDPDHATWKVGIQERYFRVLQRQGHLAALARIICVGQTFESTLAIIQGWGRPDKEDCHVYVGRPPADFRSATIQLPPPRDQLFVVFVLPDGTIDHWNWRPRQTAQEFVPEDMKGDLIWTSTA
jgi:hypothetical protein